jgi:hypothetical protein
MSTNMTIVLYIALILWSVAVMQLTQTIVRDTIKSVGVLALVPNHVFLIGFVAACFPMAFILAARYQTGTDTAVYVERFYEFAKINSVGGFLASSKEMEPGYVLFNVIVHALGGNENVLFAVIAGILFLCICKGLWDFSDTLPAALAMLILMTHFVPYTFNIMRQLLAIGFIWCSIKPMMDRKLLLFLLFILCAVSFHLTAVILLPFYFACGEKKWNKLVFHGLVAGFILFYLMYVIIGDGFSSLSSYLVKEGDLSLSVFVLRIPIFALFLFYSRILKLNPSYKILFLFLLIELIFASLSGYSNNLYRVALFFRLSWVILLPSMVRAMPNRKWALVALLCVVGYVGFMFYREMIDFNYGGWVPYQWVFSWRWGGLR